MVKEWTKLRGETQLKIKKVTNLLGT